MKGEGGVSCTGPRYLGGSKKIRDSDKRGSGMASATCSPDPWNIGSMRDPKGVGFRKPV